MGQVIRLSKFRRQQRGAASRRGGERAPRFYCHGCDNESFNLFSNGDVRCTRCGGTMKNLAVSASDAGLKMPC